MERQPSESQSISLKETNWNYNRPSVFLA